MFTSQKWLPSMTMGLLLAWGVNPVHAQIGPFGLEASPAGDDDQLEAQRADFIREIPTDDDQSDEGPAAADKNGEVETSESQSIGSDGDAKDASGEPEVIKERFSNGAVKIERQVTQDLQGNYINHGMWRMYDQRGNPVAQGEYNHGNRTGEWVRWYRTVTDTALLSKMPYQQFVGPFISQATFKDDQLDGTWTIWDSKKHPISRWEFSEGRRHGASIWWFSSGRKMREAHYVNGELNGTLVESAPDGAQIAKEIYQSGRKLGKKTTQFPAGGKKAEGMFLFAKEIEQTPDDWWNCKLLTTTKTGKDERHGAWATWHPNGQHQCEGAYEHDLQVGLFTWWHSNGQKALEGRFENGKQDGTWTWWHANGQKSIHGEFANGNPTGRWTWWKEDGKVAQSADLSHSEGVVIDTPAPADPKTLPQAKQLRPRTQPKR